MEIKEYQIKLSGRGSLGVQDNMPNKVQMIKQSPGKFSTNVLPILWRKRLLGKGTNHQT